MMKKFPDNLPAINMDWENINNSEITDPQIIPTAPFDGLFDGGSFSNLPQPSGGDIDRESLVARCDEALYKSKENGRNRAMAWMSN